MDNYLKSVNHAYSERGAVIILGLTGRTGSGCTTVSNILKKEKFEQLDLRDYKTHDHSCKDDRKYEVIHKFMETDNRWQPFTVIEGSSVIFSFILENGFQNFSDWFSQYDNSGSQDGIRIRSLESLKTTIDGLQYMFKDSANYPLDHLETLLTVEEDVEKYYTYYTKTITKYKKEFQKSIEEYTCYREILNRFEQTQTIKRHLYTSFMQTWGNNIRSSGNPYKNDYTQENFYDVAKRIDAIIQIIQKHNEIEAEKHKGDRCSTRICIDAIRNPYEAYYFKDKYSSFYLMSINVEDAERRQRMGNLDEEEQKSLDYIEYEESNELDYSIFFHQDMQSCLAMSDIHLYNPKSKDGKMYEITQELLKYIALMLHPGLVAPSHVEHCMQTAYVSKLNSGCLSRQVGAAITGEDYSIKAVGWNEVPEGQVPCNLRCVNDYCANKDKASFSQFELENPDFQKALYKIKEKCSDADMHGFSYSYCFKEIYNAIKNDKNQVYTRALHAEENAFLQLSKNGGQGIKGGKLFTTASPCELCAKKAYQLGIREIYYIDPYPGISEKHILSFGEHEGPKMILFTGVIGDAYIRLYTPRIPIKDEIKLLSGVNNRAVIQGDSKAIRKLKTDRRQQLIDSTLEFITRTDIRQTVAKSITALCTTIDSITEQIAWSGSSIDGMKVGKCSKSHNEFIYQSEHLPYEIKIPLEKPLDNNESLDYTYQVDVKDAKRIMNPYYAHLIYSETDCLKMTLRAPKGMLVNVKMKVYADLDMSNDFFVKEDIFNKTEKHGVVSYTYEATGISPRYSYSFEWEFAEKYGAERKE